MKKKNNKAKMQGSSCNIKGPCSGCGYFLGFLGSAIYYISTATGFWVGVLGVLKSLVWPAFVVFELLKYIGA
jgi:hypothetical protein